MKQKYFYRFPLFTIMVVLVFLGCTKQGPAGATGPQGLPGATGPAGPGGSKGDTGTANVIYSNWDSSFSGTTGEWVVPQITTGILDSGVILVYITGHNDHSLLVQLPYIVGNFFVTFIAQRGFIVLNSSGDLNNFFFRYIIIPGSVPSGNSIPKDYLPLCRQYNIPDN